MNTKLHSPKLNNLFKFQRPGLSNTRDGFVVKKSLVKKSDSFSEKQRIALIIEGQSTDLTVEEFCDQKKISLETFYEWTSNYLSENTNSEESLYENEYEDWKKFSLVIEGKTGETSVAEICRREDISHTEFLKWCTEFHLVRNRDSILRNLNNGKYKSNKNFIVQESNKEALEFIENYVDISDDKMILTNLGMDALEGIDNDISSFVGLGKINSERFINKYFEKVNSKLQNEGLFIGCLETFSARRKRLEIKNLHVLNSVYFSMEFLFKRVLPKVSFTKKYYFDMTKGQDRLLSKAEALGRLVSCGFKIMDFKSINGKVYFVVKKISEPFFDESPSYGPLYKMPRLGKNGEIIGVYKFRTMHPYSEYLQDFIVNAHGYASTGKPANDFRIPKWGKIMRKFWLDEIPQLINVLKGDMRLVGVRPVSKRYFQDIPKEMQKLRVLQKPGCIPPYVALNKEGKVSSVLEAEMEYLKDKISNPFFTDVKYFFKAIFNIVFLHKRSA